MAIRLTKLMSNDVSKSFYKSIMLFDCFPKLTYHPPVPTEKERDIYKRGVYCAIKYYLLLLLFPYSKKSYVVRLI